MKKLFLIFFCTALMIIPCGCKKKAAIFFNNTPITKENVLEGETAFDPNTRIYYLFASKKPIKADFIRVQISQASNKGGNDTYNIVFANDYKIIKEDICFYQDYFVLRMRGKFLMQIFDKANYYKPLAYAIFWIR